MSKGGKGEEAVLRLFGSFCCLWSDTRGCYAVPGTTDLRVSRCLGVHRRHGGVRRLSDGRLTASGKFLLAQYHPSHELWLF